MCIRDSSDPVPGGGSIAALNGAVASALAAMVANLTIGKKNYDCLLYTSRNTKENAAEENIFLQVAIKRGMQSKEASTDIEMCIRDR